jgi:hypothetical protein
VIPMHEVVRAAGAVAVRPRLWRAAIRLVPPRWWSRWPCLPLPSDEYLRFRMETMYGAGGGFRADDVVEYLEWCRRMGVLAR